MKLTDFQKEIAKLDTESKNAILALIDLKTETDMEKALSEIKNIRISMENKMESVNFKLNTVMWVIGVLTVLGYLLPKIKF